MLTVAMALISLCISLFGLRLPITILRRVSGAIFVGLAALVLRLGAAFITTDTGFTVVREASRRSTSTLLRLAGLWGGARSSLLLWTLCAALVTVIASRARDGGGAEGDTTTQALRVRALLGVTGGFALISALTANPFARESLPPTDGRGLAPILEHPAMLWHPPLMYAGLITTMTVWAHAVFPTPGQAHETRLRRSLLAATVLLGSALLLGALWAYEEQGWGGYWAWDPVENGGLLPWMGALVALHWIRRNATGMPQATAPPQNRTGRTLAAIPFGATCLGAITTRAGVMPSVHGFAEQRTLGLSLVVLTIFVIALTIFGVTRPAATQDHIMEALERTAGGKAACQRSWLRFATLTGLAMLAVVFAGTYFPVLRFLVNGQRTQTTGTFYGRLLYPMVLALLVLMSLVRIATSNKSSRGAMKATVIPALLAVVATGFFATVFTSTLDSIALFAIAATTVTFSATQTIAKRWRMSNGLAHAGFALLVLGFAASMTTSTDTVVLAKGKSKLVGELRVTNLGITVIEKGDRTTVRARVALQRNQTPLLFLEPSLVGYPARGILLAETSIDRGLARDVHVALRRAGTSELITIDVHDRPLTWLVWFGAATMQLGVLGVLMRKLRTRPSTKAVNDAAKTMSN
jgi:cytochrome c-type biogenesis protein CcmF